MRSQCPGADATGSDSTRYAIPLYASLLRCTAFIVSNIIQTTLFIKKILLRTVEFLRGVNI